MTYKYNPFEPNSPTFWMFAWRRNEIEEIDKALCQTKRGNPNHILLIWERGIWKSSLLLVWEIIAKWEFSIKEKHNFLSILISLNEKTSPIDLVSTIKKKIEREVKKIAPAMGFLKDAWEFITKFEVWWISYKKEQIKDISSQIYESTTLSICDIVNWITSDSKLKDLWLSSKLDGLVILIDEVDKANEDLDLGTFLKNLSETLISERCNYVLLILAGLPNTRDILRKSHESSLRLFKELYLWALSKDDVKEVVDKWIKIFGEKNTNGITVEDEWLEWLYKYSEWYPHFVQQIWFSAVEEDKDFIISKKDVTDWFFKKWWALEAIWERYYKKLYYTDINTDAQREVLDIMAEKWNEWVKRDFIKKNYSKGERNMNNAIKALKEKNIILTKEWVKWEYRLQWVSFAFWVKNHHKTR